VTVARRAAKAAPGSRAARPASKAPLRATNTAGVTYESAAQTRRTRGWNAPTTSPNTALLYSITTLRDRSRSAVRNNGYGKGAIDHLVTNIIGTGIKPMSQATDPALRRQIQELFTRWTDESDADGLLDFYGQQAQAVRGWLTGGETYTRLRPRFVSDGLSVPLQLQNIEPEISPAGYNDVLANGNRVRASIEFDPIGRRLAYYFYPQRPGDLLDYDPSQLRRVPAESVAHLYDPVRAGQIRGEPHLTPALIRLFDLDKFDDAVLLGQQLANMFVAFLSRPSNAGDAQETHPLTGLPTEIDTEGNPQLSLEPGIFQELGPGEDVKFSTPPQVGAAYVDFTRQQLYHVAAAAGVPYETLTGDLSRVNDRTVRVILAEFRRRVMMWQHQIVAYQWCRPVYQGWLDRAVLAGALPIAAADYAAHPEDYAAVKWVPQGWPYINPVQDIQASKDAVRAGFSSRSAEVSSLGEDAEVIDAEQQVDNTRADAAGLRYDSDGRQATTPKLSSDPATPPDPTITETTPVTNAAPPMTFTIPVTVHANINEGAIQAPVTLADGAVQTDVHVTNGGRTVKTIRRNAANQITAIVEEPDETAADG
jgi:lambda family phage portal protein